MLERVDVRWHSGSLGNAQVWCLHCNNTDQPWSQWQQSVINLGGPGLRPHFSLRQSSFFLPSHGLSMGSGQNPLIRCQTIWCNLYSQTALLKPHWCLMYYQVYRNQHVHAEFSHCRQNWYYGLQAIYSSMALKSGGVRAHLDTHTARKWGGQDPHRIATTAWSNFSPTCRGNSLKQYR